MELYQELLALNQNISRFERYLFKQYPILNTEYLILITLSAKKAATSGQLAEALKISKPTISRHIKRLLLKNHISKSDHTSDDQRSFSLVLTASGTQLLKEIEASIQQNKHQLFKEASAHQINQLIKDIRTLNFSLAVIESDLYNK